MTEKTIYFDNNSSSQPDDLVVEYLKNIIPNLFGNPSSAHFLGKSIKKQITKARDSVALLLNVRPNEIIFTSSGTEGINMAIRGIAGLKVKGHIITSAAEHSAVIEVCKHLENLGFTVTYLKPGSFGAVTKDAVAAAIRTDTFLVALMAVNNETGVKTDVVEIAKFCSAQKIDFFVDAVAQLGKELVVIPEGVSAMAFSGHKIHALQGVGALFIRSKIKMAQLVVGGEQEYGRRAGTENVIGILSFGKAAELLIENGTQNYGLMKSLRDSFESILMKNLTDVVINGEGRRVSNVSNLAFLGVDGETMLLKLDRLGIYASHGSACSSGALEPSRVLQSMGLPIERVESSIRFSFSRLNTLLQVEEACAKIIPLVNSLR